MKTRSLFIVLFLALTFFFSSTSYATTYYVDPINGNDSWSGTVPNGDFLPEGCEDDNDPSDCTDGPWKTISKVNSVNFSPGDKILFKRGTESIGKLSIKSSGTEGQEIIVGAYGTGTKPVINGNNSYNCVIGNWEKEYIIYQDLHITNNPDGAGICLWRARNISIINCEISNTGRGISGAAVDNYDLYNWTIKGNEIHDNIRGIWANYGDSDPGESGKIYNVVITQNTFYNNTHQAVKLNSVNPEGGSEHLLSGLVFTYNTVYSHTNATPGGSVVSLADIDGSYATNTIAYNVIYNNSAAPGNTYNGLWLGNVSHAVVEHNLIYNNSSSKIDGVGIFLDHRAGTLPSHDIIVRYNRVYNHNSVYDREPWGPESQFNSAGIGLCCGVYNNQVYYNLLYGNATGISLGGSSHDNLIYNNTLTGNRIGFYYDSTGTGNIFKNNIVANNTLEGGGVTSNWGICGDAEAVEVTSDYNLLYNNEKNCEFHEEGSHSIFEENPLFFSDSDFHLKPFSPAIDAGTEVGLTRDYDGNPIYGLPDIGAYEYQPPYLSGEDKIDITGKVRIYGDGKYRYLTPTSSIPLADFSLKIAGNDITKWVDVSIETWQTSSPCYKKWTETGSTSSLSVIHTIGDLSPNKYYSVYYTKPNSPTKLLTTQKANENGKISFTYNQGFSEIEFEVKEDTNPPSSFSLLTPSNNSKIKNRQPTFSWSDSFDSESGLAKYQLFIDNGTYQLELSTSTTSVTFSSPLSCGKHTWFVRATDKAGNFTDSSIFNFTVVCGGGRLLKFLSSSKKVEIPSREKEPKTIVETQAPKPTEKSFSQIKSHLVKLHQQLLILLQKLYLKLLENYLELLKEKLRSKS